MQGFHSYAQSRNHSDESLHIEVQEIDCALKLLRQATSYAKDVGEDQWQFAVEIEEFRKIGLTDSALRWLLCKGTIKHAEEVSKRDDRYRSFRTLGLCVLTERACFVLATDLSDSDHSVVARPVSIVSDLIELCASSNGQTVVSAEIPTWDSVRHELRLGETVVKRFKHRSPNQEAVLTAFQEEGWPYKVDDPLPQSSECDPKRRLSDTIRGLNHHQLNVMIRFRGDGTGEAVIWELADSRQRHASGWHGSGEPCGQWCDASESGQPSVDLPSVDLP